MRRAGVLMLLVCLVVGCGDGGGESGPRGTVTGTVTMTGDASPVGLKVMFADPSSGRGATGIVAADGTYSIKQKGVDGLPVGSYRVSVLPGEEEMSDADYDKYMSASPDEQAAMDAAKAETAKSVPEKYLDGSTSGLTFDVAEGAQTFDITLE